jgi:hypothetical protein
MVVLDQPVSDISPSEPVTALYKNSEFHLTSHLTQPLDVGAFGPLKSMYSKECQMYLQKHPGINITKYEIAELTRRPYIRYEIDAHHITEVWNQILRYYHI